MSEMNSEKLGEFVRIIDEEFASDERLFETEALDSWGCQQAEVANLGIA